DEVGALLVEWLRHNKERELPHLGEANPQSVCRNTVTSRKGDCLVRYGLVESFFKNDGGHNVTVNGDRYRAMITNFSSGLNNHDVQAVVCYVAMAFAQQLLAQR
ncbi:hypothetical protein TNCV_80431, partial [Trichonephila clavipes]